MTRSLTFICRQKINFILHDFLEMLQRYWKLIVLGTLSMPGYAHPKWKKIAENVCVYLQAKIIFIPHPSPMLFWRYCKDMQTLIHSLKMIVSTCKRLPCLSACEKYTSSFPSFLRYYILKEPAIWLADSILAHYSRTRISPDMGLVVKHQQQY